MVAVGNLYPVKGHSVLLHALAQLASVTPGSSWQVAIVGRGDEEAALTTLAAGLGLDDRVQLLGYRADVPDILAAADAFVMPSKPVVASEVGGVPEVVRSGREALLVPPGDPTSLRRAIQLVFSDTHLRKELGSNALRRAEERYTLAAMTDAYEGLYTRAVA
jgi:glycosyltransferase involved in cell wall biosynthesis